MFDTHVDLMPIALVVINALVLPLIYFAAKMISAEIARVLTPYIGDKKALVVQQRVNELMDKGIGAAALKYLPELQAQGLTVDVGNLVAAEVARYCASHAPDLVPQIAAFEGSLEEKAKARLIAHPAIQAAIAPANDNAALQLAGAVQQAA